MTAKTMDLLLEQGATFELDFTWADTSTLTGVEVSIPKDLTDCKARMQLRAGYGKTVMVTATTENGRITLGGADGGVHVRLSAGVTDQCVLYHTATGLEGVRRRARYDLEVQWPDGTVDRVLEGRVLIHSNITRTRDEELINKFRETYVDVW